MDGTTGEPPAFSPVEPLYARGDTLPSGNVAPGPDPSGIRGVVLVGGYGSSCIHEHSNRVQVWVKGSLRAIPVFSKGSGEPVLLSADFNQVLRTLFTVDGETHFWDEAPANGALSVKGYTTGLIDIEVATTDPDSLSYYVIDRKYSPLFEAEPHASGTCSPKAGNCLPPFPAFHRVMAQLTETPAEQPLPLCKFPAPFATKAAP